MMEDERADKREGKLGKEENEIKSRKNKNPKEGRGIKKQRRIQMNKQIVKKKQEKSKEKQR